ncbi:MalY/PatB family protein [Coprobacter fastidiosus]|jgi:cystathionine beta-lyase|uniref:MalY/PatB family protein n=1 Tax=Coprobacter fastidiosus TaxID=1099853 RepID=UPI00241DB7D0|nr:MalY/PatB family protein [Coprobacter fastidiosus]
MKYNFDEIIPRRGTNSYKWDTPEEENVLPMWVADMDFRTAPAIIETLRRRVEHGIFGYTKVPQNYYDAIVSWFINRHQWEIDSQWIIYTSGVVPAISAIIKAMTIPGDKIIVQTPVYNCFYSSIRNNGCKMIANNLIYQEGRYTIDFDDLEHKAADPETKLLLLCNPHNPVGRVWTSEELQRIGDICLQNGVFIIADEIHCELTYEGHNYTPFASLSEEFRLHSATCISPSKAFNLAGLQIANIVAADSNIRSRIDRAINDNEVCDVNPFGVIATIAAYEKSEEWLDALRKYLWENYTYIRYFFKRDLPQYSVLPLESTYLVWIDCRAAGIGSDNITSCLQNKQKLMVNSGTLYGPDGEGFIRLNIACPRKLLIDGLVRLAKVLGH